jgi:murein DD-endopeptidase MepM/ murein hydrolase activator NlpD
VHRRIYRALLATTVLLLLTVPTISSIAGPRDELRENRRRLSNLEDRIDADSAAAKKIREEVKQLNAEITELQMAINRFNSEIAELQDDVDVVEAEAQSIQSDIDEVENLATQQATLLYKSGGTETIDALFSATSVTELNDRLEMMGIAAQENTQELVRFSRLKTELQVVNQELFDSRDQIAINRAAQRDARGKLAEKRAALNDRLDRISDRLSHNQEDAAALAAANDELRDKIISAQAQSTVTNLGTSSEGFIWPLNGAINSPYGYRWGTLHTGIDIDGVTGEPIVAARSGSVILAGAMSGYGNAVTIDHGGGVSTLYGHMSAFNTSTGASVQQGEVIGYVGCTGSCTGDHLHFEVRINGNPTDPMAYLP